MSTGATPISNVAMPMGVMLVSGACNTLLMKMMTRQMVAPGAGMLPANFDYPFFQSMLMMIGELMCLGVFLLRRTPHEKQQALMKFPPWIMAIPVTCDWTATTLVNAAYVIIPASTIQMCRGCVVLFTCMFSMIFLGRKQEKYHMFGVFLVVAGITLVSLQAVLYGEAQTSEGTAAWIGITLCIGAQIFQSTMMVVEEKYLNQYSVPPLQMVGLEGAFGCMIGLVLLSVLQPLGVEKTSEAMYMIQHSPMVQVCVIASMFSIAFFNWSGVTVTQNSSATARSTIDVTRTVIIWVVELTMHWNVFSWMQLAGFVILTFGTLFYNRILTLQCLEPTKRDEERTALVQQP